MISNTGKGSYWGGSGATLTFWISVAASTVLIFYGYDQGVFGNVIVGENFLQAMGNPSVTTQGNLVSLYNLGCFAGAISTMWLGDIFGRPKTLLIGSTIVVLGAVLQSAAFGLAQMLVGRVVAGFGTGMNTSTAGLWQAETSKMRSRGRLIAIQMTLCAFGLMVSNWLTLGFSFFSTSIAWRFPLAFQIVFAIIIWVLCPRSPESPRLLIRKGRFEQARQVLAALEGHGATPDSAVVAQEFALIKEIFDRENIANYTWRQLLAGQGPVSIVRRMILGSGMQAMNQLCGINIVAYYATYVFIHSLGFSNIRARILSAGLTVDFVIVSIISCWLIENQGRRKLMMYCSMGMSLSWVGIAISLGLSVRYPEATVPLGILATVFFFMMFGFFGVGFDPVTWVYPSEINSLESRTKGASMAMATNWILNYMIAEITPNGIQSLQWRFWIIWATLCAAFVPVVYFLYPETSNRSLEDVDRFFEMNNGLFIHRDTMATAVDRPDIFATMDDDVVQVGEGKERTGGAVTIEQLERI